MLKVPSLNKIYIVTPSEHINENLTRSKLHIVFIFTLTLWVQELLLHGTPCIHRNYTCSSDTNTEKRNTYT